MNLPAAQERNKTTDTITVTIGINKYVNEMEENENVLCFEVRHFKNDNASNTFLL